QQKGPVVNIGEVELHPVFEADLVAATDLPEASHAGFHTQPAPLPTLVACHFLWQRRSGTNQAHVALQNIEQLGKFVDAAAPDDLADAGDSWVTGRFENRPIHFIERLQLEATLLSVTDHGAELVHRENAPVPAAALLLKQNRTGRRQLDENGCR